MDPVEIQNAKALTVFLKKGECLEKGQFLANLSNLMSSLFFEK